MLRPLDRDNFVTITNKNTFRMSRHRRLISAFIGTPRGVAMTEVCGANFVARLAGLSRGISATQARKSIAILLIAARSIA
jgi:hypothetical protein